MWSDVQHAMKQHHLNKLHLVNDISDAIVIVCLFAPSMRQGSTYSNCL